MLSEEEKKAIEKLVKKVDMWKCKRPKNPLIFNGVVEEIDTENNAINTVLNLITKLEKENEEVKRAINVVEKEKKQWIEENNQKDKRIKELEEELEKANRQLDLDYVEENFIPKQVIKDKIEKIIRETTPTPVFKPKSMWDDTDYERLYKTQPLLELLEGGSK